MVYGLGLVQAHEKAELQNWAGTVLHETFIDELANRGYDVLQFLTPYAKKFKVPYKKQFDLEEEFVLNLIKGDLNQELLNNTENNIRENFARHNKSTDNEDVQTKIENTLIFLRSFYNPK